MSQRNLGKRVYESCMSAGKKCIFAKTGLKIEKFSHSQKDFERKKPKDLEKLSKMGSSSTKQAVPVQTAHEVIIDNSSTKGLINFHWRTFGVSSLGFVALLLIAVGITLYCFRALRRQHRRERRRLEDQRLQPQHQGFPLMPFHPLSIYTPPTPPQFAFSPNRFEDLTNQRSPVTNTAASSTNGEVNTLQAANTV